MPNHTRSIKNLERRGKHHQNTLYAYQKKRGEKRKPIKNYKTGGHGSPSQKRTIALEVEGGGIVGELVKAAST